MTNPQLKVLLVCENPSAIHLLQHLFKESQIDNCLDIIEGGMAALDYSEKDGEYPNSLSPDLILMDISLHLGCGFDTVGAIKANRRLCKIPLVALLASEHEKAIVEPMQIGVDHYLSMPLTGRSLMDVLKLIFNYPSGNLTAASGVW